MNEQREIITSFSEMAPRYEQLMNNELNRFWGLDYHSFVAQLLSEVQSNNKNIILDVATGTSYIPAFLIKSKIEFKKIIGLDITLDMLLRGKALMNNQNYTQPVLQVCATAHEMPFVESKFNIIICCLATHHMNVAKLLKNIFHSLEKGGYMYLADAGGSSAWKNWLIKNFIKAAAFSYFLVQENFSRAVAESQAIPNIYTSEEWKKLIIDAGFSEVQTRKLKSKKFWAPDPLIIQAKKI